MSGIDRRLMLSGGLVALAGPALAQNPHAGHAGHARTSPIATASSSAERAGRVNIPDIHHQQAYTTSPAPMAPIPAAGRRGRRCPFRAPRWPGRSAARAACISSAAMPSSASTGPTTHLRSASNAWITAAEVPRGANHVGVAVGAAALCHRRLHRAEPHAPCRVLRLGARGTAGPPSVPCPRPAAPSPASMSATASMPLAAPSATRSRRASPSTGTWSTTRRTTAGRSSPPCRSAATMSASSTSTARSTSSAGASTASTPTRCCTTPTTRRPTNGRRATTCRRRARGWRGALSRQDLLHGRRGLEPRLWAERGL